MLAILAAQLKLMAVAQMLVHDQLIDELDTSLFLAIHGKYGQAVSCLRRVLEVGLHALLIDHLVLADKKASWEEYRDSWLEGRMKRPLFFSGEKSVLRILLDSRTEKALSSYFMKYLHFNEPSLYQFLREMYRHMSSHVHVEPISTRELYLEFAEYDERRFDEWRHEFVSVCQFLDLLLLIKFPDAMGFSSGGSSIGFPNISEPLLVYLKSLCNRKPVPNQNNGRKS